MRFAENGDWYANCPVVLDFDGIQVEVCHWQFDEISISWGTIDTVTAITGWEQSEFTPVWSHTDERLGPFTGRELQDAALLEWRPSGPDLAARSVAVEFVFDTERFHIANGLDENDFETGAAEPDYARHRPEPLSAATATAFPAHTTHHHAQPRPPAGSIVQTTHSIADNSGGWQHAAPPDESDIVHVRARVPRPDGLALPGRTPCPTP